MSQNLDRTVVFRKPALIVRPAPAPQFMTGGPRERHVLMARAIKLQRRGIIAIEWDAPRWDQQAGQYLLKVRTLRTPPPAWRKPVMVASVVLAVLCALGALAWHALTALSGSALGVFLLAVAGAFAALVVRGRQRDVTVTTTTIVRIRR